MDNQPKKQNNFIVFLKSILPMAVAIGVQLVVQIPFILVSMVVILANSAELFENPELLGDIFQQKYLELMSNPLVYSGLTLATMLTLAIVFIIWFKASKLGKGMAPVKKVLTFRNVVLIIAAGYFTQLGISLLLTVLLPLFPKIQDQYSDIIDSIAGEVNLLTVISVVILAPIAEELVFRGLTFRGTIRSWQNFALVNTLQALYFGIYHMNIVQGIYAFAMGLVFGYVAYKLNNVFASMLFHAAVNGSGFLLFLPEAMFDSVPLVILIAAASCGIVWALVYLLKSPYAGPAGAPVPAPQAPGPMIINPLAGGPEGLDKNDPENPGSDTSKPEDESEKYLQ